jgi:HEAT repeat protein
VRRHSLGVVLVVLLPGACRSEPKQPDVAQLIADLASSDQDKSGKASVTIVSKGTLAVPGLIEMLGSSDPKLRSRAAATLWGLGPSAAGAVPALAKALGDASVEVRRSAATALGGVGADAAPAVPALSAALKDSDNDVRQFSAKALGAIGPLAKAALPALQALSRHEGLRETAVEAMRKIQGS